MNALLSSLAITPLPALLYFLGAGFLLSSVSYRLCRRIISPYATRRTVLITAAMILIVVGEPARTTAQDVIKSDARVSYGFMMFKVLNQTIYVANGLQEMSWQAYGINFGIPPNFKLMKNDGSQFLGTTDSLVICITPFKDYHISDPLEIAQLALDKTPGSNKQIEFERDLNNMNGLKGYVAYATATVEGDPTHIVIAGFLNPRNDTNFIVQLLFLNGTAEENEQNRNLCIEILNSFKPRGLK